MAKPLVGRIVDVSVCGRRRPAELLRRAWPGRTPP